MSLTLAIVLIVAGFTLQFMRTRKSLREANGHSNIESQPHPAAVRLNFTYSFANHPIDQIKDERIAIATATAAFIALDGTPPAQLRSVAQIELQSALGIDARDGSDLMAVGQWLATESGNPQNTVPQAMKRLCELNCHPALDVLVQIFSGITAFNAKPLSSNQSHAITAIRTLQSTGCLTSSLA